MVILPTVAVVAALEPLTAAMRIKGKLENYGTVDKVFKELVASLPEDQADRKGDQGQRGQHGQSCLAHGPGQDRYVQAGATHEDPTVVAETDPERKTGEADFT